MQIAFITQQIPYGKGEAFILAELMEFIEQGHQIIVFPIRPESTVFHEDAKQISHYTTAAPLVSFYMILQLLQTFLLHPLKLINVVKLLLNSRSLGVLLKNLAVLPKAFWIARSAKLSGVQHIHAYWASTSSTAAMIVSYLTGIPWSFTSYRWDIAENNLLKLKYHSAKFIRCPDRQGTNEIMSICELQKANKLYLIRSGVRIPELLPNSLRKQNKKLFCFAVPAMFVEKKGHIYLLEAIRLLANQNYSFLCWLIGDGPLRQAIEDHIVRLDVSQFVEMKGLMRLEEMYTMYREGLVDVVVLPSIVTSENEKEGIPVSLIDAMSFGVPVISTLTGGITELVLPGSGFLVEPCDSTALAQAMEHVMHHRESIENMAKVAREIIDQDFNVVKVVKVLVEFMQVDTF